MPQPTDQPLKIVMVSSEAVPFAKTGGLADVVGALSLEFAKLGHEVYLVIPRYPFTNLAEYASTEFARFSVPTPMGPIDTVVQSVTQPGSPDRQVSGSLTILAIQCDQFFNRSGLYQEEGKDYPDNLERFSYFCRAAMELLLILGRRSQWRSAVLHLHDWQAALCAVYLKTLYASHADLADIRCVLTLHNLGYQGLFSASEYWKTGLPDALFSMASLEYYGSINLLKGGIVFADFLTTVSPTYSFEIQTSECGFGLEGVLSERKTVLRGIVNGIDTEVWNPQTDPFLKSHYSASKLKGKKDCKLQLQQELNLEQSNTMILGMIARLTSQKGLDLVLQVGPELMEMDIQLIILGRGESIYVEHFLRLSEKYPRRVAFRDTFDEGLAHRIEAGADVILMPSLYEPCGLTQLYSLRYGTVPLVRKTGGLADTVVSCTPRNLKENRATGFMFTEPTPDALLPVLMLATAMYDKKPLWRKIVTSGMRVDNSWSRSATAYINVFRQVVEVRSAEKVGPERT
jgi:starch synthase